MAEFMEKNLTGNRKALYKSLKRGIFQSDNESTVISESLWYQTKEQVEKVENPE
jgi:hypothetical protein